MTSLEQKMLIKEDLSTLPDSELVEHLLAGDRFLLGQYLKNVCYVQFEKYAKKFFSLKLEADEIMSITSMLILRNDMNLVRKFKENRLGVNVADLNRNDSSLKDTENGSAFQAYIYTALRRCLSDMLEKDSRNPDTESRVREDEEEENKHPGSKCNAQNKIYLDALQNPGVGIDAEGLSTGFSYLALDLNRCIAKLPIRQQKMFYMLKVQRYKAEEVSNIFNISVKEVYAETERIRGKLKEMLKNEI